MKKNIAIVTGGNSSETVVSVESARQVMADLDKNLYNPYLIYIEGLNWHIKTPDLGEIPVNCHDFTVKIGEQIISFDMVLTAALHGAPAENGQLQGYLEMLNIPYTGCDLLTSSLTFDKYTCNNYLKQFGIKVAPSVLLRPKEAIDESRIEEQLGLPCFVKPTCGGSSFGVSKVVAKHEIKAAVEKARQESRDVLIEAFIDGTELACGIMKTCEEELVFAPTEIVSKNAFFDYEAKYTPGMAEEITPARINKEQLFQCQKLTSQIYDYLNCRGIVRVDFILSRDTFYFLEINTLPGLSAHSIVPQQIENAKVNITELYTKLIEDAFHY